MFVNGFNNYGYYNDNAMQIAFGLNMLGNILNMFKSSKNSSPNSVFTSSGVNSSNSPSIPQQSGISQSLGLGALDSKVGDLLSNPSGVQNMSGSGGFSPSQSLGLGGFSPTASSGSFNPFSNAASGGGSAMPLQMNNGVMPFFETGDYGVGGISSPLSNTGSKPSFEGMMQLANRYFGSSGMLWNGSPSANGGYIPDLLFAVPPLNINGYNYMNEQQAYQQWANANMPMFSNNNLLNLGRAANSASGVSTHVSNSGTNMAVNTPYNGTAADLNSKLGGVLKGKGQTFLDAQKQYGINAAFLASICLNESAHGTSKLAVNKNNVGGVRYAGSTEFRRYNSVDECIMHMGKFLKSGYLDKGITTIGQIGAKYCPVNDPTDKTGQNGYWATVVSDIYRQNFA